MSSFYKMFSFFFSSRGRCSALAGVGAKAFFARRAEERSQSVRVQKCRNFPTHKRVYGARSFRIGPRVLKWQLAAGPLLPLFGEEKRALTSRGSNSEK